MADEAVIPNEGGDPMVSREEAALREQLEEQVRRDAEQHEQPEQKEQPPAAAPESPA